MIKIEVFTAPGCSKCGKAKDVLKDVVSTMPLANNLEWAEINILDDIDYAVDLGVLSTPAIAIDGELVFTSLPSVKELKQALASKQGGALT